MCANLLILMPQREGGEAEPSPASAAAAAVPVFSDTAQAELAVRMGHGKRDGAAVRLVQGDYLVGLYERGEPMRPRQELPEAAFYDGPLGGGSGVNLIAVSYPWLSKRHPDPDRFHLNTLAPLLKAYASTCERSRRERGTLRVDSEGVLVLRRQGRLEARLAVSGARGCTLMSLVSIEYRL